MTHFTPRLHQPNLTTAAVLRLETEVDEEVELPLVWLTAAFYLSILEERKACSRVEPHLTKVQLEAR